MTVRVLLADDDPQLPAAVSMLLDSAEGIDLAGVATTGQEAVRMCAALAPDVVLMDVRMPVLDGIEATRRIVASGSPARIIVLTTFDLDAYVFSSLRAGASGFLLKRSSPERLIEAIETVARGDGLIDPAVTMRFITAFAAQPASEAPDRRRLDPLTARERDVLRLIGLGRSNAELAEELFIAESTVKTHVKRILMKLGARDRAQAVVAAYESGLVAPNQEHAGPG